MFGTGWIHMLQAWPALVFGWPAIIMSVILFILALQAQSARLALIGAMPGAPFCWYLSGTPRFGMWGWVAAYSRTWIRTPVRGGLGQLEKPLRRLVRHSYFFAVRYCGIG